MYDALIAKEEQQLETFALGTDADRFSSQVFLWHEHLKRSIFNPMVASTLPTLLINSTFSFFLLNFPTNQRHSLSGKSVASIWLN